MVLTHLTADNGLPINDLVCGTVGSGLAGTAIPGWMGTAGIALIASVMILAFFYMLSVIFRNPNLNTFIHFEIYELLTSVLLIVFTIALVQGMCNLTVSSLLPSTDPDFASLTLYEAAQQYFVKFDHELTKWLAAIYFINFQLDQLASATFYSRPLGIGMVAAPLAGLSAPFKQITYNVTSALAIAMIINNALLLVYEFSLFAFLKWYLPLGLILRSFSPTRRIGGTLIAIAIGFLFIFPAQQVITGIMFLDPTYGNLPTFTEQMGNYWEQSNMGGHIGESLRGLTLPGFLEYVISLRFIGMLGDVASAAIGVGFTALFLLPLVVVAEAFGIGYLMPAVNILILIQAVRHLSRSFGEEIDITALTRMI